MGNKTKALVLALFISVNVFLFSLTFLANQRVEICKGIIEENNTKIERLKYSNKILSERLVNLNRAIEFSKKINR
jgi:hypothetical protein